MKQKDIERGKIIKALRAQLAENKTIVFAYMHGTFLEGNDFNDIDFAIYLGPGKETDTDLSISRFLSPWNSRKSS